MTESPQSGRCSSCASEAVKFWKELDSWICSQCGSVLQVDDTEFKTKPSVDVDLRDDLPDEQTNSSWQERVSITDKSESNLVDVLELTEDISESLSLSDKITTRAAEIVTGAWETNFMHGRTKDVTVGSALYIATREAGEPVAPGIIADQVNSEKSAVKSVYQDLRSNQEINLDPPTPQEYVKHICNKLDLPDPVADGARKLLSEDDCLNGNPIGIAAAGVYEAGKIEQEERSFRQIAIAISLTKETVWQHAVKLRQEQT